jgi:hypothetical protein
MIRTCPQCGDFYADALLAFCIADGTPLTDLAPDSERWSESARVIEEKENALRKQKRKLKWRRIVVSTMAMTTLVVLVMAVSSLIYIESVPKKVIASRPSIPETTPAVVIDSIPASATAETSPAPSSDQTSAQTPAHSPVVISTSGRPPECSAGDKGKEERAITDKYGAKWQKSVKGNQPKIAVKDLPAGILNVEALARSVTYKLITEYQSRFPKPCVASVRASYAWQITINFNGQRKDLNKPAGAQYFTCEKKGETWHCP